MHVKNPLVWKRIAASTLAAAMAVTGAAILAAPAASAAPAATAAAPTQTLDAKLSYSCNVYVDQTSPIGQPTFPNKPITTETIETVPATVTPGEKIPATKVTLNNDFSNLVQSALIIHAVSAIGGAPGLTATFLVNNQAVPVPINNVKAPLAQIPQVVGDTWIDVATGTSAPLTVPNNAKGNIIIQGPTKVTIEANLSQKADGSDAFPTTLACTAPTAEDLTIGRVSVIPAGSQSVDVTNNYLCDAYVNTATIPTDGTTPTTEGSGIGLTSEVKANLPTAVSPGGTIPATDITDTVPVPGILATEFLADLGGDFSTIDKIGTPDGSAPPALGVTQNGTPGTSSLSTMAGPAVTLPPNPPVLLTSTGTTSAISVANNAQGSITIAAPRQINLAFTWEPSAQGTAAGIPSFPTALQCTLADPDATLAVIKVIAPAQHASLTTSGPKSSVYGTAVKVPVSANVPAVAAAKPAPAGGSQNVDALRGYTCNYWLNQTSVPTDGTPPNNNLTNDPTLSPLPNIAKVQASLPAAVNPGSSIASTNVSLDLSLDSSTVSGVKSAVGGSLAGFDKVSLTDTALDVNGTASPLTLGNTALTPAPTAGGPTLIDLSGGTSAITVPSGGSGDLTIGMPAQFDIAYTAEPASTGTAVPVAEQCTLIDAPFLASIHVVRPLPKPAASPVPTGKILITTAAGKGVAQGTLSKGKAIVSIPGTALPVGKSTLKVSYPGDSNTLNAPAKTITVVKTKAAAGITARITPAKVVAGRVFPTVTIHVTGPGTHKGGTATVVAGGLTKHVTIGQDGSGTTQFAPFASAGAKTVKVSFGGNAYLTAKTASFRVNAARTALSKFGVKVKPGKIVAKKTRATLLITLGAPDKLGHGLVTVKLAGRVIAKKVITGTGKITLPKFPSAGRKLLKLTFTGNGSVVAKTVTKAVKVTKRR